ncbi:hypothetical protein AB0F68_14115 [Micromonospora sp. NPDC023966]
MQQRVGEVEQRLGGLRAVAGQPVDAGMGLLVQTEVDVCDDVTLLPTCCS